MKTSIATVSLSGDLSDKLQAIAAAGFVSCDLYDGCFLYDFARSSMRLVDLDEYRPGPFRVGPTRLPGITR